MLARTGLRLLEHATRRAVADRRVTEGPIRRRAGGERILGCLVASAPALQRREESFGSA
jgi:hypothetical protein